MRLIDQSKYLAIASVTFDEFALSETSFIKSYLVIASVDKLGFHLALVHESALFETLYIKN